MNDCAIRWLVSICDTIVDHGAEVERREAMLVSMFINMLRLAKVHRYLRGPIVPDRLAEARLGLIELYDGVCTFHIDRQDTFLNLSRRRPLIARLPGPRSQGAQRRRATGIKTRSGRRRARRGR